MRLSPVLLFAAILPAATLSALADDKSVEARLTEAGIEFEKDKDGDYKITYTYTKEDRTQLVFVSGLTETIGDFAIREVFAPAAKVGRGGVDGKRALKLLAESRKKKIGSWEIEGEYLVYVAKLPDTADSKTLQEVIEIVSTVADNMEIEISGKQDKF